VDQVEPSPGDIAKLIALTDLVRPMAIRTAVTLRLPDLITQGADTVEALADATHAVPRALRALIGVLADADLVVISAADRIRLTPLGAALTSAAGPLALALDADGPVGRYDLAVLGMPGTVRTGRAAFETLFGQTYWEYVASSPDRAGALGTLQPSLPAFEPEVVVDGVGWSRSRSVLDLGGSNGALLSALLNAHDHLSGAVLDLPGFQANAESTFALTDRTRARYIAGDFFKEIPRGFDTYLLSAVLYDWDDDRAVRLLGNLAAIPERPRILVSEISMRVPGTRRDHGLDLQMYCGAAGFERTAEDVARLATRSGLQSVGSPVQGRQRFVLELRRTAGD
jgi:hypothetical protein